MLVYSCNKAIWKPFSYARRQYTRSFHAERVLKVAFHLLAMMISTNCLMLAHRSNAAMQKANMLALSSPSEQHQLAGNFLSIQLGQLQLLQCSSEYTRSGYLASGH